MLVSDLLTATIKLIGGIAKSEVPSADEMADAFARLNSMVDSWGAERQMIYQLVRSLYPLVSGQQVYSIGTAAGATFNAVRPMYIQDAGLVNTAYTPNFELPMRILTIDEWASLSIKSQQATQSWYLWNDYAYPNSNLSLWPIPNVGTLQLALYVPTPLTQFANTGATVSLPPGYEEALRYNLAVRLCPEWGRPIDPVVAKMAQDSFALVQRANTRLNTLGVDIALVSTGQGIFNFLTGLSSPYGTS